MGRWWRPGLRLRQRADSTGLDTTPLAEPIVSVVSGLAKMTQAQEGAQPNTKAVLPGAQVRQTLICIGIDFRSTVHARCSRLSR